MKRALALLVAAGSLVVVAAGPAWACAGLVNPNGTVSLTRTATLAGYRNGVEHYITSFEFQGDGAEFGSIVPLPGIPTRVRRGGDWTLQRLQREVAPAIPTAEALAGSTSGDRDAKVILETKIDSVQITILKGGGDAVGRWAKENGFSLTPDAPEVLDYYASMSQIFMAARFDPEDAKKSGKKEGDGVPIHLTIPTDDPWVPLRILALGQPERSRVEADVFLLTKREPRLSPVPRRAGVFRGLVLERSEAASDSLLADLRSDKGGMKWVSPNGMWLTYLRLDKRASNLVFDLDASVPNQKRTQRSVPLGALWSWAAAL